jgi:hypothetical protein
MKGKLILLTVILVGFIIFVVFKFFIFSNQNVFGKVKIISSPTTSVFIDNVAVGRTPYEEKAKVGEFILKLIPEGNATETASWQGKIKIYKNSLTYINRELGSSDITSSGEIFSIIKMEKAPKSSQYGEVYVETDPNGSIVYLDNDEKGIAPLVLADVVQGDHELSVNMPGFFKRTQKIHVEGSYRVNASFKLAIDQSQTPEIKASGEKTASESATTKYSRVLIKDTPTGWLRVREAPNLDASESARINPGEKFPLLEEKEGWYKIKTASIEGWISSQYSEKVK